MSSQAQIAANRANARKSRGPHTAMGKSRSSRNALRYGFGAISRHNPAYFPEIDRIARSYCEGDTDPLLFEQALIIAENDMILGCINAECLAAIERMRDPHAIPFSDSKSSFARARARLARDQLAYAELAAAKANRAEAGKVSTNGEAASSRGGDATTGNTAESRFTAAVQEPHPPASCDEFEAMCRAAPDLARLERYRRRASSRRKRAIREFIFTRSLLEFWLQAGGMQLDGHVGPSGWPPDNRNLRGPAP